MLQTIGGRLTGARLRVLVQIGVTAVVFGAIPVGAAPRSLRASVVQEDSARVPMARPRVTLDPWLSRDKGAHFAASAFVASVGYYLARREVGWRDQPAQGFAVGLSLTAGVAKELWDRFGRHGTPSWKDLLADVAGLTTAVLLIRAPDGTIFEGTR